MPRHYCLNPHDQYSQSELLVEFEARGEGIKLISAQDASGDDVLCELEDIERRALESEITADCHQNIPALGGFLHKRPIIEQPRVGLT
ncbi:hypothetical protein [Methylobacterium sp. WL9]|uniref:hypothetical protein n=1 Tax=Methylobacterium sp. WL9 TaxID=2603898 RepID=UPI0011C81AE6|nr:hypothetical protein [Methylobacterium sp. WL9]TXN21825.1 hypothetical protein FV217_13070 [Methylobacterium sp. WL9]